MIQEVRAHPEYYLPGMPGYVLRDWEVIDYRCFRHEGTGLWFRGPSPKDVHTGKYFTAVGAAQTFGCFSEKPYPAILQERLGIQGLNLGYAGAGPAFFLQNDRLIDEINRSAFCIVQAMSGRSVSSALLHNSTGLAYGSLSGNGEPITAEAAFDQYLTKEMARLPIGNLRLKKALLRRSRIPILSVRSIVCEMRKNWLRDYRRLMQRIEVPKIFFWFSKRKPFYIPQYHSRHGVFRDFPHLVNASMTHNIGRLSDHVVRCISRRGSPQPLISRFTGQPVVVDLSRDNPLYKGTMRENGYYPSPEMHYDAAEALEPVCRRLLLDL